MAVVFKLRMKGVFGLVWVLLCVWAGRCDVVAAAPVEVYAVASGFPTSYSCVLNNPRCWMPELDGDVDSAWCACTSDFQQWIRISSSSLQNWAGVITQGRSRTDHRVEEFYITYTLNGISWMMLENGRIFKGNNDANSRVRNDFAAPVQARAMRIHPVKWANHIAMRV